MPIPITSHILHLLYLQKRSDNWIKTAVNGAPNPILIQAVVIEKKFPVYELIRNHSSETLNLFCVNWDLTDINAAVYDRISPFEGRCYIVGTRIWLFW